MTPTAVPETIASRYRVLREIGKGGMGAVYLVEHLRTGDHLALKILLSKLGSDPQFVERFKREARASARIKSDHVVRIIDADVAPELGGAPFLVMELLEGSDLKKVLKARGRLPPTEVVDYLGQVARTLDKAHSLGIIHRDLKPENIFLHQREDGSTIVKLLDFGISKMGGDDAEAASMTQSGAILGTPHFMSPEQARGHSDKVGPPADIWAIGLIANKLLTGDHYWNSTSVAEIMAQILLAPLPPPTQRCPSLPPAFDAWFARSCDREISRRWPSVTEQIAALAQALGVPSPASISQSTPALSAASAASVLTGAPTPSSGFSPAPSSSQAAWSGAHAPVEPATTVGFSDDVLPKSSPLPKILFAACLALGLVGAAAGGVVLYQKHHARVAASGPVPPAEPVAVAADAGSATPIAAPTNDHPPTASAPASAPPPAPSASARVVAAPKPVTRPTYAPPATKPTAFNPAAP